MPRPLIIEATGGTHRGVLRDNNEDSFAVLPQFGLFMVADGMGGRASGEVASKMAIDTVCESFDDADITWPSSVGPPSSHGLPLLVAGVQRANSRIFDAARQDSSKRGMGTTFAGVLAIGTRVGIAHVGDSRVYRLRDRQLELLTEDHSLVNECIRLGRLKPEKVAAFPLKHLITRALGPDETVEVDTRLEEVRPGDVLLVCSDGLSGVVGDADIAAVLVEQKDLDGAVGRLIDRANENGGPDNVTCVLVRWTT